MLRLALACLGLAAAGLLLVALGAGPAAVAAAPHAVDVVLSVGAPAGSGTCAPGDQSTCDLVRVRLDLGSTTARSVETLVRAGDVGEAGSGPSEQALSPSGNRMVWLERVGHSSQLWARDLGETHNHLLVKSGPPRSGGAGMRPEWPTWLGEGIVLFDAKTADKGDTEEKTVYSIAAASLTSPGEPRARFGAGITAGLGLEDVAVYPSADGARVVGFGPVQAGGRTTYPLTVQTLGGDGRLVGNQTSIDLGKNESGAAIEGCHHPAWNRSGTEILCMVHRPTERIGGMDTRLLYSFTKEGGAWHNRGRTFEPLTPEAAGVAIAPQLSAAAGCKAVAYKYAQFCGSDTDVVATVFCGKEALASGRGAEVGASRIFLIHTNPVQYVDVTQLVEADRGLPVGALSSFTATCRDAP